MSRFVGSEYDVPASFFGVKWAEKMYGEEDCYTKVHRCRITKHFPRRVTNPQRKVKKAKVVEECWAYKVVKDDEEVGDEFFVSQSTLLC